MIQILIFTLIIYDKQKVNAKLLNKITILKYLIIKIDIHKLNNKQTFSEIEPKNYL